MRIVAESFRHVFQKGGAILRRRISVEACNPLLLRKNLYYKQPSISRPLTHSVNADFLHRNVTSHDKSNTRDSLIKMNGFFVVSLHFVIRKSAHKKIITILFKVGSYAGERVFADANFLKCNNIGIKRQHFMHMWREGIHVPSANGDPIRFM